MYSFVAPLEICGENLYSRLSPGGWVIDTGLHKSSGTADLYEVSLGATIHTVPPRTLGRNDYLGGFLTSDTARIGCDLLNGYDVCFDLSHGTLYLDKAPFHDIVRLIGPKKRCLHLLPRAHAPVFLISFSVMTKLTMAMVTGARHSYIDNLENYDTRLIGDSEDFHVSCGRFKVDLHEITVTVGSITAPITFATEPGKLTCPAPVGNLLKATGTDGILGWQILKHGPATYLPRRGELWI